MNDKLKYFYWNGIKIINKMIKNGTIEESKLATALVNKINAKELPSVTESDNGKLLKVSGGAWVKDSNKLLVEYTESNGTYSTETDYDDIIEAIENEKEVVAMLGTGVLTLTAIDTTTGYVQFGINVATAEGITVITIIQTSENVVAVTIQAIPVSS